MSERRTQDLRKNVIGDMFPLNQIIIFMALTVLSCTFLPVGIMSLFSANATPVYILIPAYALLVSGAAFLFLIIKRSWYTPLLSLVVLFIYSLTKSPVICAIVTAVLLSFILCGYMCSILKGGANWFLLMLPVLSYIGAFALCGDPIFSLISIIPLSASALVGMLHRKRVERKAIIITSSAVLLSLIALFALLVLGINGKLSLSAINQGILNARETAISFMQNYTLTINGIAIAMFDPELVEIFIIGLFNILPAIIVCSAFIIIYISHSLQITLYERTDFDLMITEKTSKINMSIYAACIFPLSYILSLSTDVSGNATLLGVVTKNLFIILVPGLFISGLSSVGDMLKKKRGIGVLLVLVLALAAFMLRQYIIEIVAAFGAVYIIITNIDAWAQKHYANK